MRRPLSIILFVFLCLGGHSQMVKDTLVRKDETKTGIDSSHHHAGVGFAISGDLGAGLASTSAGTPELNHLSYANLSNVSLPAATYSSSAGVNVGFDLDLLFGRKRNLELSLGLTYLYNKGTADFSGYHIEYGSVDANGNPYRRLVTATHASESLKYSNVSLPLLFKYSTNPDKKLGAYIQVGPVISLSGSASGSMNADIDFEAVYHFNTATNSYVYAPTTHPGDWVITRQAIASELGPNQNVGNYFSQLYARGYDVTLDKNVSTNASKISYHLGGGMMVRAGGEYRITKVVHFLFGVTAVFITNGRSVSSYNPVTASNDLTTISISNFLNGTPSLLTMQVGFNLGLQIRLAK
jgi:hypothetical protein